MTGSRPVFVAGVWVRHGGWNGKRAGRNLVVDRKCYNILIVILVTTVYFITYNIP